MIPMELIKPVISLSLFGISAYAVGLILTEGDFRKSRFVVPRSRRDRYLVRSFSFIEFIISIGLVISAFLVNESLHTRASRFLLYTAISTQVVRVIVFFLNAEKIQASNRRTRMETKISNILILSWFLLSLHMIKIATLDVERVLTYALIAYLFFFMVFLKATFTKTYINVVAEIQLKDGTDLRTTNLLDETNEYFVLAEADDANLLIPKSEVKKARIWLEQRPISNSDR